MARMQVRDLGAVHNALAEAARTDESSAERVVDRYIELRSGMADTLGARRHHMFTGRRGTGKSTLLHVVRKRLVAEGIAVATVDMERFKGRDFPDVRGEDDYPHRLLVRHRLGGLGPPLR